jgi:hypothetical protein
MRSYYRLLILNLAVVVPLTSAMLLRIVKINPAVYLVVCLALLVANYAIKQQVARQRGISSLEIGLWASWAAGPLVTAMFPLLVAIFIIKRDLAGIMSLPSILWIASSAWTTVRKSEQDGWGGSTPKTPSR